MTKLESIIISNAEPTPNKGVAWFNPKAKLLKYFGSRGWEIMVDSSEEFDITSILGQPGGVASLDDAGKVPSSQLPSYVDDVIEVDNFDSLPPIGEKGKIYVTVDDNKTYRWSGSAYVEISNPLSANVSKLLQYYDNGGYFFTSHPGSGTPYILYRDANEGIYFQHGIHKNGSSIGTINGATIPVATAFESGVMSKVDRKFIDSLQSISILSNASTSNYNGQYYTPTNHDNGASINFSGKTWDKNEFNYRSVNTEIRFPIATQDTHGLMSSNDKKYLDNFISGTNAGGLLCGWYSQNGLDILPNEDTVDIRYILKTRNLSNDITTSLPAATTEKAGVMTAFDKSKLDSIDEKLEGITKAADDSEVVKGFSVPQNYVYPNKNNGGRVNFNEGKGIQITSDGNGSIRFSADTEYLATKESVDTFKAAYEREYLTLEGTFYSETSANWYITIGGKKYTSTTQDFKFTLDAPLVLTRTMFGDNFIRLILPKCTVSSDMSNVFSNMSRIRLLDISKVDWCNATTLSNSFVNFPKKAKLVGMESFATTHNCSNFQNFGLFTYNPDLYIDTRAVTYVGNLWVQGLETFPYGRFDMSNVNGWGDFAEGNRTGFYKNMDFTGTNYAPTTVMHMFNASKDGTTYTAKGIEEIDTSKCNEFTRTFEKSNLDIDISLPVEWMNTSGATIIDRLYQSYPSKGTNHVDLTWIKTDRAKEFKQMIYGSKIKTVNAAIPDFNKNRTITNTFWLFYSSTVTDINLGSNFDISTSQTSDGEEFYCTNLTNITGVIKFSNAFKKLNISTSSKLTRDSIMVIIEGLPETTENKILQLHATAYARLSEEDIAVATAKGWTVTA